MTIIIIESKLPGWLIQQHNSEIDTILMHNKISICQILDKNSE